MISSKTLFDILYILRKKFSVSAILFFIIFGLYACGDKVEANDGDSDIIYSIGQTGPGGGIIFYVNPNYASDKWRYLEAAPEDLTTTRAWASSGKESLNIPGAAGIAIGTGKSNTDAILLADANAPAASGCRNYYVNDNDKKDWFLPSRAELDELYKKKDLISNFKSTYYWSSSETNSLYAWSQRFSDGDQYDDYKTSTISVRAVRAF